ncbi:MAG: cytidyltransferase [Gemmatimonadetes bacterium]|nr:cytidyltransferase [Gemmatimonadota bacterium]
MSESTKRKIAGNIEALAGMVRDLRTEGKRVVMCHGVFDLVHIGHIRHFEEARKQGNALIVTLTPDRYVNKGVHRPVFPQELRAEAVAALDVVDYVGVNEWPTAVETLRQVRPDVYCKGGEYKTAQVDAKSNLEPELVTAEEVGAEVCFTDDLVFSSSRLLNEHFTQFTPETEAWLEAFRAEHSEEGILEYLEVARRKKVLVVGEAIVDEYVYCSALGKSTKDPVLAFQQRDSEAFPGGSLAVANHIAGFCDDVTLVTTLGDHDRKEEFVRDSLVQNVDPVFLTKSDSPTITKTRFLDRYTQTKLLEIYSMNDATLAAPNDQALLDALGKVDDYDIVIVADYGHGMLGPSAIEKICSTSGFLAVNTQSNAGNRGFNTISRYKRADYVCLATHEIAIETRLREAPTEDLLIEVSNRIDCDRFTVTRGREGSLHHTRGEQFVRVPAFASQVVDRVGAGDAFLAVSTILLEQSAPWEVVGLVGNVAGARVVSELGNRHSLDRVSTSKHVISLLK